MLLHCDCAKNSKAVMDRLDEFEERFDRIEKNQLIAKVTVSVLMGCSLVVAWFIDHANLLTGLFDIKSGTSDDQ